MEMPQTEILLQWEMGTFSEFVDYETSWGKFQIGFRKWYPQIWYFGKLNILS